MFYLLKGDYRAKGLRLVAWEFSVLSPGFKWLWGQGQGTLPEPNTGFSVAV